MTSPALIRPRRALHLAATVAFLDAATKLAAHELLPDVSSGGSAGVLRLGGPFSLARVSNAGSALGFAQGAAIWIAVALAGLLVALRLARRGHATGAALLLTGALANLGERLLRGGVTDFFLIGTGAHGVVLNVADVALLAGAALLVYSKSVSSGGAPSRSAS